MREGAVNCLVDPGHFWGLTSPARSKRPQGGAFQLESGGLGSTATGDRLTGPDCD